MLRTRTALRAGPVLALHGGAALILLGLAACGSAAAPGQPSPVVFGQAGPAAPVAQASASSPARLVTAKPVGGSPGKGPLVITSPTPLPGGKAGSQRVVLPDRVLEIGGVAEHPAATPGSVLVDMNLTVRDTSAKAIRNESPFFELIGPGGDAFSYQDNSSDAFYGPIPAHAARAGMIEFEIPAAAASGLYLRYRPEIPTETVLTRLRF